MRLGDGSRIPGLQGLCLALALLIAVPAAHAAEQPVEAPDDFRNGQSNSFGSIAMTPYMPAGDAAVPVEARIVLHDLETLRRASNVLLAFNLKGDSATVVLESVRAASGQQLVPTATLTVDGGRQPQAHLAPADLLGVARDGRVDLVLAGRVEAKTNGQSHLGAMAIAFDEGWDILESPDGSAQLYGFTMVMATGLGGGAMPFQGQGNSWVVLPVALLAFVTTVAGVQAVRMAVRLAPAPLPSRLPVARVLRAAAAGQGTAPRPVPVFGEPASPARPGLPRPARAPPMPVLQPPEPMSALPTGPLQGPILPPHPLHRSSSSADADPAGTNHAPRAAAPVRKASRPAPARPKPQAGSGKPKPRKAPGKAPAVMSGAARRQASR